MAQSPALEDGISERLAAELAARIAPIDGCESGPPLADVARLLAERSQTSNELADTAKRLFYSDEPTRPEVLAEHVTAANKPALWDLAERFDKLESWTAPAIQAAFEETLTTNGLKMAKLAMPLRVAVFGTPQTPSLYPTLALAGKERVLERLRRHTT